MIKMFFYKKRITLKGSMRKRIIKLSDIIDTLNEPDVEDWILLTLYVSPSRKVKSELYLQKALFIASRHLGRLKDILEFRPYRLGPYSEVLKTKLEVLENSNAITINERKELVLTKEGEERIKHRKSAFSKEEIEYIKNIANFVNALDEEELLLYTYVIYGAYEKSDVFNELLKKRVELAIGMLKKGLISTSLAAKLAGLTLPEFIKLLKQKGIKPYRADENDLRPI